MCIICVSKKGVRQPSLAQLRNMFQRNPDGAGYMFARNGKVTIHKGFMNWCDFNSAVESEHFTAKDPVVYHFRISTQAGVKPEMTHPFPLTKELDYCEKLDLTCRTGIAHNGIIRMTSTAKETRFSDTALFITDYMTRLLRNPEADMIDKPTLDMIEHLTNSKWAILSKTGDISTVGTFVNEKGLLFSNSTYEPAPKVVPVKGKYTYIADKKTGKESTVKYGKYPYYNALDDYYDGEYGLIR